MTGRVGIPDLVAAGLARIGEVRHRIGERALAGLDRLDDARTDAIPEEDEE